MDMETDEQQKARMELYNALLEGLSDIEAGRVIPAEEAIKMFMEKYPNVTIETEPTDFNGYFQKLPTLTRVGSTLRAAPSEEKNTPRAAIPLFIRSALSLSESIASII